MSKRSALTWVVRTLLGGPAGMAASCASGVEQDPTIEWATHDEDLRSSDQWPPTDYFRLTPDASESDSPAVGGYHIQALNRSRMRCADGTFADTCYVAQLRMDGMWPPAENHIVRGYVQREDFGPPEEFESLGPYGEWGVLIGDTLWAESTTASELEEGDPVFYRLARSGLGCRGNFCPGFRVEKLNSRVTHWVADLDTSHLDLTPEQTALLNHVSSADESIVTGKLRRNKFRWWPTLVVSRVFLPATGECASDDDCFNETWCRATPLGGRVCEPYKRWGEPCGGLAGVEERCAFGDLCDVSPFSTVAAVCRPTCKGSCYVDTYCSSGGCRPPGTCENPGDCLHVANEWEHADCPGYPSCEPIGNQGQCVWHCGNPVCIDATGFFVGYCSESLGYGRLGAQCGEVYGCADPSYGAPPFAESMEECEAQCLQAEE